MKYRSSFPVVILLLVWMATLQGLANNVRRSVTDAYNVAARWWNVQKEVLGSRVTPELIRVCERAYVFETNNQFLLVSTQTEGPSVLGYGLTDGGGEMPPALLQMLSVSSATPCKTVAYPPQGAQWKPVEPLLQTIRHQYNPYNKECPYYRTADGMVSESRCIVGCVATAMEQILTYYRRTYTLCDTLKGWSEDVYTIADVLPGESVDTRIIANDYDAVSTTAEQQDAVAKLSYWLGVACHMQWGLRSSGAHSIRLVEPLKEAFGLKYVHYIDSYDYDPVDFWNLMAAELMAARPVYFAGSLMRTSGHAFVLDGLDGDGYFHVNWGYAGRFDGYFRLDILAHPQPECDRKNTFVDSGFFCYHEAIVLHPDEQPQAWIPQPLERTGKEVEVEAILFPEKPLTGCYSPVQICVHNTDQRALTTSFVLMLNNISDTNWPEQAHWLNSTGCTLPPDGRDTLLVYSLFPRSGDLRVSASIDGKQLLYTQAVWVSDGGTRDIQSFAPQLDILSSDSIELRVRYVNSRTTERAAEFFIYDLLDKDTGNERRVDRMIMLPPASDTIDVLRLSQLRPGGNYTLRLRHRWPIVQSVDFTLPLTNGIEQLETLQTPNQVEWFTLEGMKCSRPVAPGIYLRRQGSAVKKVVITR